MCALRAAPLMRAAVRCETCGAAQRKIRKDGATKFFQQPLDQRSARGDLALGCNGMSSIQVGKDTQLTGSFNINSRGTGKISVRATTNQRMSLGSVGFIPIFAALLGRIRGDR